MPPNEVFYNQKANFLLNAGTPAKLTSVMSSLSVSSKTLLQIAEELESEDQEVILFACRDLSSQTKMPELLSELNEQSALALVEVLTLVKRFDLLKKYLKMTKNEAEHQVATGTRVISDYSKLLADINEQMEEDNLESLVFLLKKDLRNAGRLKQKTFLCLVSEMEKNRLITPENLDLLEQSLLTIRRVDLKNRILKFKQKDQAAQSCQYINAFAVSPAIHRNQPHIEVRPWSTINGHKAPVQEIRSSVQETTPCAQAGVNDERYPARADPLGFCLIIDCIGNDADMLVYTFRSLNFIVKCHKHKSVREVKEILQNTADMDHLTYDLLICILISLGDGDSLFCEDNCLPGLPLQNIKRYFNGQRCPNLIGKPKLFFIQNYITSDCEVQSDGSFVTADGPSYNAEALERNKSRVNLPSEADIFFSHCKFHCRPEELYSSPRSKYLKALTELISDAKKRKYHDMQQIHTELNGIIYREQRYSLVLQHTLTRKLFLHPA